MTERLWTPWRMTFIQSEKPTGCIFCDKPVEQNDRKNYIVHRGTCNFIILNAYPYTAGHLMIVPYAHLATIEDLSPETTAEMMELAKRAVTALRAAERAESFNIGMNLGRPAGAGIADHAHLHVVPRFQGDSNFMPVIGETRMIPEDLETTFDKLVAAGL